MQALVLIRLRLAVVGRQFEDYKLGKESGPRFYRLMSYALFAVRGHIYFW